MATITAPNPKPGDNAEMLSDFYSTVPAGSVVEYPKGVTYLIEIPVFVRDLVDVRTEFNQAQFIRTFDAATDGYDSSNKDIREVAANRSYFQVAGCERTFWGKPIVNGANFLGGYDEAAWVEALYGQHAFSLINCLDTTIKKADLSHIHGDCVRVLGCVSTQLVSNKMHHTGRHAVSFISGTTLVVTRNMITDIRMNVVDIEPHPDMEVNDFLFFNNNVGLHRLALLSNGGAGTTKHVRFLDNSLWAMRVSIAAPGFVREHYEFLNNYASFPVGNPALRAIGAVGVTGIKVQGNRIPVEKRPNGVMAALGTLSSECVFSADNEVPIVDRGVIVGEGLQLKAA